VWNLISSILLEFLKTLLCTNLLYNNSIIFFVDTLYMRVSVISIILYYAGTLKLLEESGKILKRR